MQISLPDYVKKCINVFNSAGVEAFCVGGAIRDIIMGRGQPHDFDIAVNCPPEKTIELFDHTIPTGIKHGTVTVIVDEKPIEVTTYRVDGKYTDSRHPDSVKFTGNIADDLSRRDFTVNAIAYNDNYGIFDPFDGCGDIKRRILRTVGEPDGRFSEDALRIMRAFRFSSQLGFEIERHTKQSALNNSQLLSNISAERIAGELYKILCGEHIIHSTPLFLCGALEHFSIKRCDISRIAELPYDLITRFCALCIVSESKPDMICDSLKADNILRRSAQAVCELYKKPVPLTRADIKRFMAQAGAENCARYISLISMLHNENTDNIADEFDDILQSGEPYLLKHLALDGNDITALGIDGRDIGAVLKKIQNAVIEDPTLNTKEKLLETITK